MMADRFGTYMDFKRTIGKDMGKPIDLTTSSIGGECNSGKENTTKQDITGKDQKPSTKRDVTPAHHATNKVKKGSITNRRHFDKSTWEYWENCSTKRMVDKQGRTIVIIDDDEKKKKEKEMSLL